MKMSDQNNRLALGKRPAVWRGVSGYRTALPLCLHLFYHQQALNWVVVGIIFAGIDRTFGNVLGAGGTSVQRAFRHYGRQLNIILALLLVCCAVRILTQIKQKAGPASSRLLLPDKPYRLSVKVRAITSRCCSGVRGRTA